MSIAPLFHEPGFHARTEVLDLIEIPGTSELFLDPQVQSYIRAGVVSLWVAGHFVNQFANQFESHLNFANLDPILVRKYQFAGQEFKNIPAARALWETIPAPIRAQGNSALWNFHDGKDWSHIFPKAMGGSATAENGIWWSAKSNKQLGAVPMSRANIANAKFVLQSEAVNIVLLKTAKPLSAGGAIGALVGAFFAIMDYGLQYLEGKITRAELYQYVGQATLIELGLAILITGLIAGIALMFPSLVPLLLIVARPLAIVGFVFISHQFITLGQEWWAFLDEQGVLEEFVEGMAITELSLRAHDKWFNARNLIETRWEQLTLRGSSLSPDLKLRSRMTNLWNNLAPSQFLPDFNVNTYIPDIEFDLDLTQHIPQMGFEEHLASLDINMSEIIPDLDLLKPSNLPLPNYRQSAATAQNALLSAAAYLSTRPSTESPEIEYYPY